MKKLTELERELMKRNAQLMAQIAALTQQNEAIQEQEKIYVAQLRGLYKQVDYLTNRVFERSSESLGAVVSLPKSNEGAVKFIERPEKLLFNNRNEAFPSEIPFDKEHPKLLV